jgi:hypothetical protein
MMKEIAKFQRLNVEKRVCNFFSISVLKLPILGWDVLKPNFGVLKPPCTRTQRHDPRNAYPSFLIAGMRIGTAFGCTSNGI